VPTVDDLHISCPSAGEVNAFKAALAISWESDPTAGTLVCRTANGSADLTRLQERTFQALRLMQVVSFDAPLPWTTKPLICGNNDQTLPELGAWGVQYYLNEWLAFRTGPFVIVRAPAVKPDYYASSIWRNATLTLPRICTLPGALLAVPSRQTATWTATPAPVRRR
jgi:hypothetical protein